MRGKKYWDEEIETLPREELESLQLVELKDIVKFSYENSAYYRRAFDENRCKTGRYQKTFRYRKFSFC